MQGLTRRFSIVGKEDDGLNLKIAFATDDGESVNQHFGTAKSFVVYAVNMQDYWLKDVAEFESIDAKLDDKLAAKLVFLDGCVAVYCRACGSSAVKQLLERSIQPLKVVDETSIKALIKGFQLELAEGPSSWLAKAVKRQSNADACEQKI